MKEKIDDFTFSNYILFGLSSLSTSTFLSVFFWLTIFHEGLCCEAVSVLKNRRPRALTNAIRATSYSETERSPWIERNFHIIFTLMCDRIGLVCMRVCESRHFHHARFGCDFIMRVDRMTSNSRSISSAETENPVTERILTSAGRGNRNENNEINTNQFLPFMYLFVAFLFFDVFFFINFNIFFNKSRNTMSCWWFCLTLLLTFLSSSFEGIHWESMFAFSFGFIILFVSLDLFNW